jgi:glucose-6-phosphate 1-dehydrogenase
MLQLLCLIAMEPPSSMDYDDIRDENLKVLNALRPIGPGEIKQRSVRGQYVAGAGNGQAVPGYRDEVETAWDWTDRILESWDRT